MTAQKLSWGQWAFQYLKETGRCVGEVPPTGLPTDMMTQDQFKLTVGSTHSAESCEHYYDERLGIERPELQEIKGVGVAPVTEADVERGKKKFLAVTPPPDSDALLKDLKVTLHGIVDAIEFSGAVKEKLTIPHQLMHFEEFLNSYFTLNPGSEEPYNPRRQK